MDSRSRQVTVFFQQDGRFDGGHVFADSEVFPSRVLDGASVVVEELLHTA